MPVHVLVMDPIWNTESVVASTPVAWLSTPAATSVTCPPAYTPIAAPGTLYLASRPLRFAESHSLTSSRFAMQ